MRPYSARVLLCAACAVFPLAWASRCSAESDPVLDRFDREGQQWLDRRNFAKALAAWNKALARSPDSLDLLNKVGICLTRLKSYSAAHSAFSRALEVSPKDPKSRFNLALLYLHQGESAQARGELRCG